MTPGQAMSLRAQATGMARTAARHQRTPEGWCDFCWRVRGAKQWPCGARDVALGIVHRAEEAGIVLDGVGTVGG